MQCCMPRFTNIHRMYIRQNISWNKWCKSQKNISPINKFDLFTYSMHRCFLTVSDAEGISWVYPAAFSWVTATQHNHHGFPLQTYKGLLPLPSSKSWSQSPVIHFLASLTVTCLWPVMWSSTTVSSYSSISLECIYCTMPFSLLSLFGITMTSLDSEDDVRRFSVPVLCDTRFLILLWLLRPLPVAGRWFWGQKFQVNHRVLSRTNTNFSISVNSMYQLICHSLKKNLCHSRIFVRTA